MGLILDLHLSLSLCLSHGGLECYKSTCFTVKRMKIQQVCLVGKRFHSTLGIEIK